MNHSLTEVLRLIVFSNVLAIASCATEMSYVDRVMEYQEQKNQHHLSAVMAMFTEDASLHFGPLGSLVGKQKIRDIHEYDVALSTTLQFSNCTATANEVSCQTEESNDWLKLAGIESISYSESLFTFAPDGRVHSVTGTLSTESLKELGAAIREFDAWARQHEPDNYSVLFSDNGQFIYSHESGDRVLALLRLWRDSAARNSP